MLWHTDVYPQDLKNVTFQMRNVMQSGFVGVREGLSGVQDHLEGIQNKMSEIKSDRKPRVSTCYDGIDDLYIKQAFRASTTPLRRGLKSAADGSNVHRQLEKTFLLLYLTVSGSNVQQLSSLTSSSTISPPQFQFSGSTDLLGLENRPSRKRSLSNVETKRLSVQVSSVHDSVTAATYISYSRPLLFSFPI